tara:strand:- start:90 stop:938 length:849 start_codon:yes stop_codon:yes gene_type:complete
MYKKGQLTAFMIIGIIMVFMLVFVFMFANIIREGKTGQSFQNVLASATETRQTNDYINTCLQERAETILSFIGFQGGLIPNQEYKKPSKERGQYTIPYYYKNGQLFIPDIETMQKGISPLLEKEFHDCIDPSVLEFVGISLLVPSQNEFKANVIINDRNVIFDVNTSILLTKGTYQTQLKEYSYISDFKMGYILDKSKLLVTLIRKANQDPENPGAFDISQNNPLIDFSKEFVKACYLKDGPIQFITFEQYSNQGQKLHSWLFLIEGLVSGTCTKDPVFVGI